MRWCDLNPSVLSWASEEIAVPYYSQADQKPRRYFVDFVIRIRTSDGSEKVVMVEVKPESQTKPPVISKRKKEETILNEMYDWQVNQDKWAAAEKFAKERGWEFVVMTEYDLGLSKRVQPKRQTSQQSRSKAQNRSSTG